jgi:hypothetical protein
MLMPLPVSAGNVAASALAPQLYHFHRDTHPRDQPRQVFRSHASPVPIRTLASHRGRDCLSYEAGARSQSDTDTGRGQ